MIRRALAAFLLLALTAAPAMAAVDKAAILARVDEVSDYRTIHITCAQAGYQVNENAMPSVDAAATADARVSGATYDVILGWFDAAEARSAARADALFKAVDDAKAVTRDAPGYGAGIKAAVVAITDYVGGLCDRASRDRLYAKVIVSPGAAALAAYRQDHLDNALQPYGQASFQPSNALAQGDLLMMAGACQDLLPPAELAPYTADFLGGPEPSDPAQAKLRRWYGLAYAEGAKHAAELDKAACRQELPKRKAKLSAN